MDRVLNGTHDVFVLEHEGDRYEDKVEQEHGKAQAPVHLPSETGNGHYYEDEHHEEDRDWTHHAHGVYLHGLPIDDAV